MNLQYCEFGPAVQDEMFEDFFTFSPGCYFGENPLYISGRRHYVEHLCEIIFNLGQWFKRKLF